MERNVIYDLSLELDKSQNRTLELPEEYSTINEPPYRKKDKLFMPLCTSNINYSSYDVDTFNKGKKDEEMWLNSSKSWSEYHSERETGGQCYPGQHALKPLIGEKVNTLKAQYH